MKKELLKIIKCTCGKNDFNIFEKKTLGGEIRDGYIECKICQNRYDIKNGILNLLLKPRDEIISEVKSRDTEIMDMFLKDDVRRKLFEDFILSLPKPPESLKQKMQQKIIDDFPPDLQKLIISRDTSIYFQFYAPNFEYILNKMNLTGGERILDIGAGNCWTTRYFARKGCNCTALDIFSIKYLGLETSDIYFRADNIYFERVLGDMENLPFMDESFDIIFANAALHHSSQLDIVFKNILRLLSKRGKIVLVNEPAVGYLRRKTLEEHQRMGRDIGRNENIYTISDWMRIMKNNKLNAQYFFPPTIIEVLDKGEIIPGQAPIYLQKMAFYIWKIDLIKKLIINHLYFPIQFLVGIGIVMIAEKEFEN